MTTIENYSQLAGRILISVMFLFAGISKLSAYAGTQGYMEAMGVPGQFLPLVILTEILGASAIIVGYQTKISAFLLAGFTLLSALFFHANFDDQTQMLLFMKNISIVGGFLFLVSNGAGAFSIDNYLANKKILQGGRI